jgi:hypothetical protein
VPVPLLVRWSLGLALRRVFPLLLAPERSHVKVNLVPEFPPPFGGGFLRPYEDGKAFVRIQKPKRCFHSPHDFSSRILFSILALSPEIVKAVKPMIDVISPTHQRSVFPLRPGLENYPFLTPCGNREDQYLRSFYWVNFGQVF